MNLFDFLYRGATVYVAAGQIYAEAESRANLFALPEAQQDMRTAGPNCAEAGHRADLVCQARRNNVNNAYPQDAPWICASNVGTARPHVARERERLVRGRGRDFPARTF